MISHEFIAQKCLFMRESKEQSMFFVGMLLMRPLCSIMTASDIRLCAICVSPQHLRAVLYIKIHQRAADNTYAICP